MSPDQAGPTADTNPEALKPPNFMNGAVTLPARVYTDPDIYKAEIDSCFRKGWISIATIDQVPARGDLFSLDVIGEPLLIARDKTEAIHVFYNICRHRGVKLVEAGSKHCGSGIINCPYHLWGYGLNGALKAAPFWGGAEGSSPPPEEKSQLGLLPVRSAVWCGTVFVNLSGDAEPFEDFIRPLADQLKAVDLSLVRQVSSEEWTAQCNWKFAVENFLDLYHLPWVHPELGGTNDVFPGTVFNYLSDKIFGYVLPDFDKARDTSSEAPTLFPDLTPRHAFALDLIVIFPDTLLIVMPSWVQVITLLPIAPGVTRETLIGFLVGDDMAKAPAWDEYRGIFKKLLGLVNEQDLGILTALQQGRGTAAADLCRYAPYWDQLTEYFARAVRAAVGG